MPLGLRTYPLDIVTCSDQHFENEKQSHLRCVWFKFLELSLSVAEN